MKVIDHIAQATRPLISFEVIPPKRGGKKEEIMMVVEELSAYSPPFIDITSHAADLEYEELPGGDYRRNLRRKSPGTLGLCIAIQERYKTDTVCHVLCEGFTREETEDFLIDLNFGGINNILAIRGDYKGYKKPLPKNRTRNEHAVDLVRQIVDMNRGKFLEDLVDAEPTDFCIGAAGYPEKHISSPNIETDIDHLKQKIDAGAEYVVTQMVFDNDLYFRYVDLCRKAGINVPIIPGVKVLTARKHLTSLPTYFHINIPYALSQKVNDAEEGDIQRIGIDWATQQTRELLLQKVPVIHFYVMGSATPTSTILDNLSLRKNETWDLKRSRDQPLAATL